MKEKRKEAEAEEKFPVVPRSPASIFIEQTRMGRPLPAKAVLCASYPRPS